MIFCFALLTIAIGHAQIITTIAGNGMPGFSGNGGPADSAEINFPKGIAVDRAGNVYIADYVMSVIRKIDTMGIITTIAGNDTFGYSGDNGPAGSAKLYAPEGVAVDSAGNVYIADNNNNVVRKVNTTGIITTIAGNGHAGFIGDGGPADSAELKNPTAIAVDRAGNIYISDNGNNVVRKVNPSGTISTYAGRDTSAGYTGDSGPADSARLTSPEGIAVDAAGDLYIADNYNNVIRKVNTAGIISTFAGTNHIVGSTNGDGGPADSANFAGPYGVAVDPAGNVYIADVDDNSIRKVDTTGIISTFAGGFFPAGYSGDGGLADTAHLSYPSGVATDSKGNVYISDSENFRIRKVTVPVVTTGLSELTKKKGYLTVYPNPAKEELNIMTNIASSADHVRIADICGREIVSQVWDPGHSIYIGLLNEGIYILSTIDHEGSIVAVAKFIKE